MAIVAINGSGRIGRATLKVLADIDEVHVAAVNDLIAIDNLAYLSATTPSTATIASRSQSTVMP